MTKSCIESISSIVISILFKRPLLIIGHSGTSKTFCSRLVQESLNSLQAKDNLGIKKERNFRFINFQGTNDLSEDEIQKIIYKAE
jgi:MoxR-like ATPase